MINDWNKLAQYLIDRLPSDIPYDDLAQLCIGLHVYVDGIPSELHPLLNKNDEANAFAEFVRQRFDDNYGQTLSVRYGTTAQPTDKEHWLQVIASIYKAGAFFDEQREKLIREKIMAIGIGTPLAERPSHTTDRTDRVTSGSAAY